MDQWMRNVLSNVGIQEVMAQVTLSDFDLRGPPDRAPLLIREAKKRLAREIGDFVLENGTYEEVENLYEMSRSIRVRTWMADNEAMSKLVSGTVRVMEPPKMEMEWMPPPPPPQKVYIEASIASVPAGRIPEKPTAEMLSAYDDAYNMALFDETDRVSPEERGIQAVLDLLRRE